MSETQFQWEKPSTGICCWPILRTDIGMFCVYPEGDWYAINYLKLHGGPMDIRLFETEKEAMDAVEIYVRDNS